MREEGPDPTLEDRTSTEGSSSEWNLHEGRSGRCLGEPDLHRRRSLKWRFHAGRSRPLFGRPDLQQGKLHLSSIFTSDLEQYRVELERIAMVNTQEILNIQRQQSHMDFNLNGRLTTAVDNYFRGNIGTNTGNTPYLAPPLPSVQTGTNSFHLPQMTGVITPFSRAGLAGPQQLAQQHVRNDMGAEDDAVGDAGASRSGVGRSQHN